MYDVITIGSWTCPSGNSVDVLLSQDAKGMGHIWFQWDDPPPLTPEDEAYYFRGIRPAVTLRVFHIFKAKSALWLSMEEENHEFHFIF